MENTFACPAASRNPMQDAPSEISAPKSTDRHHYYVTGIAARYDSRQDRHRHVAITHA
jgi:hypothetical protein